MNGRYTFFTIHSIPGKKTRKTTATIYHTWIPWKLDIFVRKVTHIVKYGIFSMWKNRFSKS